MAFAIASSPLSSPPPYYSVTPEPSSRRDLEQYRPSKELPFELAQHVQTYLEEGLFSQALNFLLSITSNSVSANDRVGPVTIPPTSHLALAATLAVHPKTTTRTNEREKWNQANTALRLLKLVHSLVGPIHANFNLAFSFRKFDFRFSRRKDAREDDCAGGINDSASGDNDLNTTYARSHSLWTRTEDFWRLVGWSFNCACLPGVYAARWAQDRLLLEFILDVLETDWHIRTTGDNPSPEESLLWQYIELSSGGHARQRRILRAIFADGSARSLSEFHEIFAHELEQPKQENDGAVKKLEKQDHVNIDEDEYGDYLGHDDDDVSDRGGDDGDTMSTGTGRPGKRIRRIRTPSSRGLTPRSSTGSLRSGYSSNDEGQASSCSSTAQTLGDKTSLTLRLRLLRLLTYVSAHDTLTDTSPTTFPDLDELLTVFVEFIRPLSLPTFAQIVLPSASNPFDAATLISLCEEILQRTLERSTPTRHSLAFLSQEKLVEEYLPFAASKNSIEANARTSILLESLTRILASVGTLKKNGLLFAAVTNGVERRTSKVAELAEKKTGKKLKKMAGEEAIAWDWLVESGERIGKIVDGLEAGPDKRTAEDGR